MGVYGDDFIDDFLGHASDQVDTPEVHDLKRQVNKLIGDGLVQELRDKNEEKLRIENPGLKELYDQYQTMLRLVKEK